MTNPIESQVPHAFGWKCNNCTTVFTSHMKERSGGQLDGGPACPRCKAGGQFTYPHPLHEGDPCKHCGLAHDSVAAGPCQVPHDLNAGGEVGKELTTAFSNLREANIARQRDWCPDQLPDLSFRGNELAGETGEVCNVIKKLERERLGWRGSRDTIEHLAEELGDVVICADLIAISAGIDLDAAVEAKFNATSEKVGLPHRLSRRSSDEAGVRVKALMWSEFTSDENVMFMTAAGLGVRYEVFHKASDVAKIGIQVARFLRHADDLTIADEDELDDSERVSILGYAADLAGAYAMAQADYDPRILSAIDQFAENANSSTLSPSPSIRAEPVALPAGSLRKVVPGDVRREAEALADEIWHDLDEVRRATNLTDAWAGIAEMCGDDIIRFASRIAPLFTSPATEQQEVSEAMVEAATRAVNAIRISFEDRLSSIPEGHWTAYDEKIARAALIAALSTGGKA